MYTFRFPLNVKGSSDNQEKIVGVKAILAADDLTTSNDLKDKLNKMSSVFLTSLSFAIVQEAFMSTIPSHTEKDEFYPMFAKNISFALNEIVFEIEELACIVKGLKDKNTTFHKFQLEWTKLSKGNLVASVMKTASVRHEMEALNTNLRTLRCLETDPEITWHAQNNAQRRRIALAMDRLEQQARIHTNEFVETWRMVACENHLPPAKSDGSSFRIDTAHNLTSIITRELRQRNKPKSGITFIYIMLENAEPILTSYKDGVFGILALDEEPHTWVFSREQNKADELKPIFAADEKLDSRYLTATMALGVSLYPPKPVKTNK
jgi:hypothetical protein